MRMCDKQYLRDSAVADTLVIDSESLTVFPWTNKANEHLLCRQCVKVRECHLRGIIAIPSNPRIDGFFLVDSSNKYARRRTCRLSSWSSTVYRWDAYKGSTLQRLMWCRKMRSRTLNCCVLMYMLRSMSKVWIVDADAISDLIIPSLGCHSHSLYIHSTSMHPPIHPLFAAEACLVKGWIAWIADYLGHCCINIYARGLQIFNYVD